MLNPVGVPVHGVVGTIFSNLEVLWIPGLLMVVVAASAPLVRMRTSVGDERQQLKWIAYAVIVSAVAAAGKMKRGAGLTNMADRLDALGGELQITSSIGTGTTISRSLELVRATALQAVSQSGISS
jgi:signal transduction histidine kinase